MQRKLVAAVALALCAAVIGFGSFNAGPPPVVELRSDLPAIGKRTAITVTASEPVRGLTSLRVELEQGGLTALLAEKQYQPRPPWLPFGNATDRDELTFEVGRETVEGLREGQLTIRATADRAPAWLRSPPPTSEELVLDVKVKPPTVTILSTFTYAAQGGAEAVVYRVSPDSVRDGVQSGDWFFPGWPLPGGGHGDRFALFGVPYDLDDGSKIRLVAEDAVGNSIEMPCIDKFTPQPLSAEVIRLSEPFMARVVPPILAATPDLKDQGSPLANYLLVNGELRRRNAQTLIEQAKRSKPAFLWRETFLQIRNAKVMSEFAARRSYELDGRQVDVQDHLGFDLASTRHADLPAVNDGVVLMAGYLGIYGNTVLIDHGYGLVSLYGHLSEISVAEGSEVKIGQMIGKSGQTGLAGGDHLHFTMLLGGLPVNPREWWDGHWIQDRLKRKLGSAMPYGEPSGAR